MRHLVEYMLEDGGSILVEVDEPETRGGITRAARPGELAVKATQTFESAIEKIKPTTEIIINKLRGLSSAPDKLSVEFGLKMSAEAGALIAAASAEANYKITLTWNKEKTSD